MKVVKLSTVGTGHLYPQKVFLLFICQRVSRPQGHGAAGRIISMKNSNDIIGNRTRDLLAFSALCQTTSTPRTPDVVCISFTLQYASYVLNQFCHIFIYFVFFNILRIIYEFRFDIITLVNIQNVSVTKIVDSSTIQRAETKYRLRIQFLALVVTIHEVWLNA